MADVFLSHLEWTGHSGRGAAPAEASRDLAVSVDGVTLPMSSAPAYGGDPARVNPEQLFVAALSACQALTYLSLAARSGVRIVGYTDDAEGWLGRDGARMRMSRVALRPRITIEPGADRVRALELVDKAHARCFIGNSVSTPVEVEPTVTVFEDAAASSEATSPQ
jgi:organic hydroperoxide reductase OsmC/OhrA